MKKTIKLFISQLMRTKTDQEIMTKRQELLELVKEAFPGHEFILLPSFMNLEDEAPYSLVVEDIGVYYLAQSIELLSCADLVVFEEKYFKGRGTRIEHEICEIYGFKHFHEWELKDEEIIKCALKKP